MLCQFRPLRLQFRGLASRHYPLRGAADFLCNFLLRPGLAWSLHPPQRQRPPSRHLQHIQECSAVSAVRTHRNCKTSPGLGGPWDQ
ncbi:hypothetical protein LZ31DRAFT_161925 [Colletotrichum somersetense]|nr:hypothetical protein LZ31DRAFT_161925 [Colletotrichum somersetense]